MTPAVVAVHDPAPMTPAAPPSSTTAGAHDAHRVAVVLVLLAALVGPAAVVLLTRDDDDGDDAAQRTTARVGRLPVDVAVDGSTVWIASGRDDRVVGVDGRALAAAPVVRETGSSPLRVATALGSVWTANAVDGSVTRLNPLIPGAVGRRIRIGADAVDVAVGPDGRLGDQRRARDRDPHRRRVEPCARAARADRARSRRRWRSAAARCGWSTRATARSRASTRARTSCMGRRIRVGRDPQDIAVGLGSAWVANRGDGTVSRLSARTGRPQGAPLRIGGSPGALAVAREAVLVLDSRRRLVLRIEPRTSAGLHRRPARRATRARSRSGPAPPGWSTPARAP